MSDYTSLSRVEWISLADRLYNRLERDCQAFSADEWNPVTPYLGWRVRDVLAHLTTAMPINFRPMLDRALADNPGAPPEFNTFARNARAVAERRNWPVSEVLREYRAETDAIMAVYRGISDAEWLKPAWFYVGPVNVRTLFLAQLGDTMFHERDVLLVNGRWQGFDPAYGALVNWFLRELRPATFRPDQADGVRTTAVFNIKGVGAGSWTMTVKERTCSVVPGTASAPDVVFEAIPRISSPRARRGRLPSLDRPSSRSRHGRGRGRHDHRGREPGVRADPRTPKGHGERWDHLSIQRLFLAILAANQANPAKH